MSKPIISHHGEISREERAKIAGFENKVLWFTGLSGSGKTTIAREVEKKLHEKKVLCYVLDGDNIRHGLNKNLGFSKEDREENIRRIGEVTKLFYDAGITVLVCFISPYKSVRKNVRDMIGEDFIEIFVDCSLEACEARDTKGLYAKARAGEVKEFTGISAPYEAPENAELVLCTHEQELNSCVDKVLTYLKLN